MRSEKGSGIIVVIIIILIVLFIVSASGGSNSSSSSKYKTQYQKDIEQTAGAYNMKSSDVDAKVKAVEKALKNK